jgi:Domain of unknown function DUF11
MKRLAIVVCAASVAVGCVSSARAASASPAWLIRSSAMPTYLSPFSGGNIVLLVTNNGALPSDGSAVSVTDTLPAGLTVTGVEATGRPSDLEVVCENTSSTVNCTYSGSLAAENTQALVIDIQVQASVQADGLLNTASASGGGAAPASVSIPVTVSTGLPAFGLASFAFEASGLDGALDTQAGAHPNLVTANFELNNVPVHGLHVPQSVKSVTTELPLGFIGNPQAAQKCPEYEMSEDAGGIYCPAASVIGTVAFGGENPGYLLSTFGEPYPQISPLFNIAPQKGFPAEFGFNFINKTAIIYTTVAHTAAGYVVRATVPGVPPTAAMKGVQASFFGDPATHDGGALGAALFFTNPVDCSAGPLTAAMLVNSEAEPENVITRTAPFPAVTGCERLHFEPSIAVHPETTQADSPSGVSVDLKVPQNEGVNSLATPELKDATVTLPAGVSVSPPSADGLAGCPASGPDGINLYQEEPMFPEDPHDGLTRLVPGHCPAASQIGTVKVTTPLLTSPLEGHVYLAQPACGSECSEADAEEGRMIGLYIEVEGSGVNLKLPGAVEVGGGGPHSAQTGLAPGQLRTRFLENPQLPFSDLQLTLKGGAHAPLATPQVCGEAQTSTLLVPWSAPQTPSATPGSAFQVDWDGSGGACPAGLPFGPGFSAGTVTPSAAAFTPFVLSLTRNDREQGLSGLSMQLPKGLLGVLKGVPLCPEPQATQGTCGGQSLIGHVAVGAGAGSHPFNVNGQVFLTGAYKGAPFGLSVVVPAVAGPFDLGTVVVRAAIHIDPHTAQVSIDSDPFPQSLDGIPLRLKTVGVMVDRPGFIFNPTSCAPQSLTGTIASAQGADAGVSSPFAVAGCAALAFKPSFKVSTQARTSKKGGASLDVKVGYPKGVQANIRSVAVTLPKQLPSRLTTIQQACTQAVFDANPASCPAGSVIGTATARTPILASALMGPAYLVSHGGAAFPDLVVILQGEGVTVQLIGSINIKKGVTSSTFASVPDAPISAFELKLPEGPHSGLAAVLPAKAKGNLCGTSLAMPTTITGQNGAQVRQSTKIAVSGCPKAKRKTRKKRK